MKSMKTDKNIQGKIEDTFKALEDIETVNVSPFFKEKTMQRLFAEKEEEQPAWSWFTPRVQLTTLVFVLILNGIVFTKLRETTYVENVGQFAESYELSSGSETSILNYP